MHIHRQIYIEKSSQRNIETFIERMKIVIERTKTCKSDKPHSNLDTVERQALRKLPKRSDFVITNADEGGVVVIIETKDFIKIFQRQLNDKNNYQMLPQDTKRASKELVNQAVDHYKK